MGLEAKSRASTARQVRLIRGKVAPTEYAVTCQMCKRLVCFAKAAKAVPLIRNDGERVWLCRRCFDLPVEGIFVRADGMQEEGRS